jgi:hypothetical protein
MQNFFYGAVNPSVDLNVSRLVSGLASFRGISMGEELSYFCIRACIGRAWEEGGALGNRACTCNIFKADDAPNARRVNSGILRDS